MTKIDAEGMNIYNVKSLIQEVPHNFHANSILMLESWFGIQDLEFCMQFRSSRKHPRTVNC